MPYPCGRCEVEEVDDRKKAISLMVMLSGARVIAAYEIFHGTRKHCYSGKRFTLYR
jgi:hypothetical protein